MILGYENKEGKTHVEANEAAGLGRKDQRFYADDLEKT